MPLHDGQSSIVLIITPLNAIMKDQILSSNVYIDALSQSPLNSLATSFACLVEMFLLSVTLGISFPQPTHMMASSMM